MTGKQAIFHYLKTHQTFTSKELSEASGLTINCITKNAIDLERARKIVRVSKVWRTVTIAWRRRKSRPGPRAAAPTEYFRNAATVRR